MRMMLIVSEKVCDKTISDMLELLWTTKRNNMCFSTLCSCGNPKTIIWRMRVFQFWFNVEKTWELKLFLGEHLWSHINNSIRIQSKFNLRKFSYWILKYNVLNIWNVISTKFSEFSCPIWILYIFIENKNVTLVLIKTSWETRFWMRNSNSF